MNPCGRSRPRIRGRERPHKRSAQGDGQFTLTALQAAATVLYSVLPAP